MVGLQGSGTSTWVTRHLAGTHVVVSKDHWPNARRREARQQRVVAERCARAARGGVLDPGAAGAAGEEEGFDRIDVVVGG